jgi:S1-C subfamily serine protease
MKLYSRGQLILIVGAVALVVALVTFGIVYLRNGSEENTPIQAVSDQNEEPFQLVTSPGNGVIQSGESSDLSADELETISVFEARNDGVVNISTERLAFNWILEPVPAEGQSGSGSIVDSRGYVLTNNHVIEGAAAVMVTLADGTALDAEIVGTDPENDLAVLKVDPGNRELATIPLGDSADLRVGQKVLAIGNPFAIGRTLTTGVISGLGRSILIDENIIDGLIQTDASINPGNSGGPLLNSIGEMIGINTMIYSQSGGSIGIGFAVPVDTAKRVLPDLIQYGVVRRGWIQVEMVRVTPQLARYAGLSVSEGVLVSRVVPGGNADQAGLRGGNDPSRRITTRSGVIYLGGDVIIAIDGTPTPAVTELNEALEESRPGDQVTVTYLRGGRQRETVVTLVEKSTTLSSRSAQ